MPRWSSGSSGWSAATPDLDPRYGPWDDPKPVWVQHDGRWFPGQLICWDAASKHPRCGTTGLAGNVRYHVGPGLQHVEWVHADRVRQRGEGFEDPNAGVVEPAPERPF